MILNPEEKYIEVNYRGRYGRHFFELRNQPLWCLNGLQSFSQSRRKRHRK